MTATLEDRLAIVALNDDFGHLLDHGDVAGFLALFTEDAAYSNGDRHLAGREDMERFFTARAARGRVSRHLYSGLRIGFDGDDAAQATSVWLTFAGEGPLPIRPAEPFAVADVSDTYRRTADGWRIASRQISPVMLSDAISELPTTADGDNDG